MYEAAGDEKLVPIEPPLPEADAGAPSPCVVADEHAVTIAYLTSFRSGGPRVAVVRFVGGDVYFGRPNDEALEGHPLASFGLEPYEFVEVVNSAWVAAAERRNRVHDRHDASSFADLRHFVLPFHDSTIECLARGCEASVTDAPDPWSALLNVVRRGG